jgi:hypothetical protein
MGSQGDPAAMAGLAAVDMAAGLFTRGFFDAAVVLRRQTD